MSVNLQSLEDIRIYLINELNEIYTDDEIRAITNLIIKTHPGIDRLHQLMDPLQFLSSATISRIVEICSELKTGKPLQYVLGETIFYGCIIKVNNETLIPRPETEELVDLIINENPDFSGRITDIGTGSGCIAIAVKKNLPDSEMTAIDISQGALNMAAYNAVLNQADILFLNLDILNFTSKSISKAEIIVCNPPYVLESEKNFMKINVLDFEPHIALFVTDEDPIIFYRKIICLSDTLLVPGGRIYFEINENKGEEICKLMELRGYTEVKIINDINGKNRFVKGIYNG